MDVFKLQWPKSLWMRSSPRPGGKLEFQLPIGKMCGKIFSPNGMPQTFCICINIGPFFFGFFENVMLEIHICPNKLCLFFGWGWLGVTFFCWGETGRLHLTRHVSGHWSCLYESLSACGGLWSSGWSTFAAESLWLEKNAHDTTWKNGEKTATSFFLKTNLPKPPQLLKCWSNNLIDLCIFFING